MLELLANTYVLMTLIVWSMIWKGWSLWVAGNKKDKFWFVLLFIVNTLGILEMTYIFVISKAKKRRK